MDEKYSNLKSDKVIEFKETVKAQLAKLVDHVDVNVAADAMCADFFASRLPPYGYVKKDPTELDEREPLTQESKIKITYPEHMRIVYDDDEENTGDHGDDTMDESDEEDEMEDDERPEISKTTDLREKLTDSTSTSKKDATSPTSKKDTASPTSKKVAPSPTSKKDATSSLVEEHEEEDEEEEEEDGEADIGGDMQPHIKVLHTLNNDRFWHMGVAVYATENACIRLHVTFAEAALHLLNNCNSFTAVNQLLMDDDE